MKKIAAAFVLSFAFVGAAHAAGPAPKKPEEAAASVPISPVALPIVVGGKVVNYVFVNVRLDLAPRANGTKLREQEPYFRDALVRAAHRTPFTIDADLTRIDETKLKAALLRDAAAIAGPGAVKGVTVVSQAPKSARVARSG